MKIKEYLEKNKCVLEDISSVVGVTKQYMWMISSGRVNPSAQLAEKIHEWSNKEIAIHEIRKCTKTCAKGCPCSKKRA